VADVAKQHRREMTAAEHALFGIQKLKRTRSSIPAATHVDYSAQIQTVHRTYAFAVIVVKRPQGGSDFDLDRLLALCPPCHAQTDAPYARGRLVITLLGDRRFLPVEVRG